ncbi:fibrinogen-like YCDxxxxGGGW domain-containing protein [Methylobacterium hispanicum]
MRASDGLGFYADQTLTFIPSAAVRAQSVPPAAVSGPNGEDLRVALYDDRGDTAYTLAAGQAVTFTWDRWVQVADVVKASPAPRTPGVLYAIETLAQDGSWRRIGSYAVPATGSISDTTAASGANRYGRTFRIVNTSGSPTAFSELRPDNGPGYGVSITTPTDQRLVDESTISGATKAGFDLQLAGKWSHPASKSLSWMLRGVTPIGFAVSGDGVVSVPRGSDFPFGRVIVPVQAVDDRGYTRDADYPFVPASVRAKGVIPQSVVGPNGEDLFVAMYDGRSDTTFTLGAGQSITYTFDRFVTVVDGTTAIQTHTANTYVIEVPNQNGGWTVAVGVQNGSQNTYNADYAASKIFRIRNALTGSNLFYNAPLDGAANFRPQITTSTTGRVVDENGIRGASPAAFTLQLAATDNYPAGGRITWSAYNPLPEGVTLSADGLITVPPGTAFPSGNVTVYARATNSRGFAGDAAFPFRPDSVRAATVSPVSVVGPGEKDLRIGLYDNAVNNYVADLATDHAVVYTYDRFVRVENFTQSTGGYATNTNYPNVELQVPNQFGGWSSAGYFYYNSSTAFGDYLNPNLTTSKVFRVVTRRPMSVAEFRLDGAPSYGLTIATSQAARTVNGAGIIGANPAGTSLQLAASTSNPAVKSVRWTLTGVMPTGFTLSESGLATVPTGPEFPFGVVNMPVRALDDQGFGATGNFQFQAASVRANTVAPDSVVGPNNEDLRIALYDGSASTFTLQAGQSITYTYDRFVQVSSVSPGSGYVGNSLIAGQINQLSLEVPNQYGGWTQVAVFWADSSSIYASSLPWADNTAKIFRVRNLGSQATRLSDFRLDNPPSYGLAIGTGTQLRYVDDTNGIDTIRDASPAGLGLQLAAQPGHPLSKSVTWSLTGVTPTGFTLGADGLLTVPALADFPFGLVTVPVQAKDDRGYTAFATYSFMANSVRARTVPPVSVAGPNGEDLATVLYDGGANTRFTLQPGASVTYTYDRYVTVADAGIDSGASAAYYLSGVANGSLRLEAPLQDGGWQTVAFFDTNSAGVAAAYISAQRASKVFRLRNVGTPAITLFDFRLDRAQSYGAAITTAVNNRIVGAEGLSIQLTAVSGHPDAAGFTWSLSGATPIGFTLSSAGFLTVPVGPDFPFGFVNMPVQAVDTKGFRATANFGFLASSVDARTIKPASVVGPGGEDLFAKLYDGDTSTAFDLQSGASVTFTFDRFVNVTDVSTAAGAYAASMSGTGGFLLEVPMQDGSWGASHRFAITDSTFTSSAVFNNVLNQSRIFRLRNTGAATTSLKEFRLDAPASYGLTWGQGGTFFVGDDRIASTNNGTTAPFTDGLTLIMQATSGYPGDPSVSYGWKPGFVPPEGFSLTNGGVLTVPAASVFPAGTVALPIRATSALGFHSLDRTFTFVPQSVRAATVAPASVLDPSGQSVYAGLYDDDVSTSSTNALTLAPGQSVTWTYPKWTHLLTTSSVVANASSTTLLVERQLPDGSWQTMETRAMSGGTSSGINLGTPYPSKVWRLRNVGQASAPLIEWRLDGAGSYAPVFGTTLSTRYVTPSTIVDAVGGGTPTANSTGLTMRLLGTVRSPGEGSLAWSWGNGFMPPEGFTLSADGLLTVTDREAFPFGLVQMPIKATDPRGFGVTRVTNFSPDPARANAVLRPAQTTVKSPTDADLFTMMIDGVTAAGSTLEAGQSITWTFSRYVYLQSAATGRNLSSQSWQLEVPNQIGGWTAVENQAGLLNGSDARIARTYRLRNVGASAITVGEYNIDGATQGSAPTPLGYGSDGQGVFFVGDYSGSAVTFQLRYSSGDPYRGGGLSYVAGTLPAGITVSSTGLVSVPSGKRYSVSDTFQVTATNALNRSSVTTFRLRDTREVGVVQFLGYLGWADGSYADSCHAYRNPAAPKVYNGATGDGVYRINPQGVVFDVYCDMTTDGGGWTQAFVLANGSIEQIYDQLSVMYVRAKQLRYLNRVGFRQDTGSGAVAGAKYAAICDLPNAGGGSSLASSLDSISWGPLPNVTTGASASSLGSFPPVNLCRWKVTDGSRGGGRGGYEDTSALLSMDPQATAYEVDYAIGIGQMETAPNVNGEDTVVWIR